MPKELHEIKNFMTGTVTTPSETDIPDDAASYSLNIDPVAEDGILKGIPDDTTLQSDGTFGSTSNAPVNATAMASVNDDGTYRVVYFDDFDNKIKKIDNLQGGAAFLVSDTISAITQANPAVVTTTAHPFTTGQKVFIDGVVGMTQVNDNIFTITSVDANRFSLGVDSSAYGAWSSGGTAYGASPVSTAAESVTGLPTMQVNNKEVHIGMGNAALNKPLWCGIIPHSQFGGSVPSGLQLADAELKNPSPFPNLYKIVADDDNDYVYGIEWGGQFVYKFSTSTKKVYKRSEKVFTLTQGLTWASDGSLWVVDRVSSVMHVIKINTDEMADIVDIVITGGHVDISDIIEIGTKLWFSRYGVATAAAPGLWNSSNSVAVFIAGASSQALTNRTPFAGRAGGTTAEGSWTNGAEPTNADILVQFDVPKVALVDVQANANTYCGWGCRVEPDGGSTGAYFEAAGSAEAQVFTVIQMVNEGSAAAARLSTSWQSGKLLRLGSADYDTLFCIEGSKTLNLTFGTSGIGNTTSIKYWSLPDYDLITSLDDAGSVNSVGTSMDLSDATVTSVTDSGTKYHVFSGTGVGRWTYGAAAGLAIYLEADVDIAFDGIAGAFSGNPAHRFFYKVSFLYDGYQEGPLSDSFATAEPDADESIQVTISLRNLTALSKRITHVVLYRASSTNASAASPDGFYRFVDRYKMNTSWQENEDTSTNPAWADYRAKTILDIGSSGASYEALNGISEVLTDTLPNYGLSTQLNNQHFIADCSHTLLDNADLFMFKSKPYNFDQFDWSVDLLRLPTKPTALASFNGRIYAFDENNTYRIEPNSFYIEDTFEGVGCIGPEAVVVTEYGMCFADKNNIYIHNGSQPTSIGDPILRGDNKSWQNRDTSWASKVVFDAERNSFLVIFKYSSIWYIWAFNIARKRWDLWYMFGTTEPLGTLTGKSGEIFISNGTNLIHYLGGSGNDNWSWYSKKLTMDQSTQTKVFKKTRVSGSAGDPIDVFISSEGTPEDSGATDGALDYVYTLSGAASRAKWIQYRITAESTTVDAIGTVFRRRPTR